MNKDNCIIAGHLKRIRLNKGWSQLFVSDQ